MAVRCIASAARYNGRVEPTLGYSKQLYPNAALQTALPFPFTGVPLEELCNETFNILEALYVSC